MRFSVEMSGAVVAIRARAMLVTTYIVVTSVYVVISLQIVTYVQQQRFSETYLVYAVKSTRPEPDGFAGFFHPVRPRVSE